MAALITGMSLVSASAAYAADAQPSVEELQAEIARLKAELAAQRAASTLAAPAAPTAATPSATAPAAGAAAAAATTTTAADQPQELEKVVVRNKQSKLARVADVPQSIAVINGSDLADELALDIGSIAQRAANVVRNVGNSRTFSMSIRDVGKITQTEAQDSSVGFLLDDVPVVYSPLASFDFYDVDAVEVARGPQGTAGGRANTVGTISVKTRDPSFTPDANWAIALGQRGTVISQLAGGGPVVDDLLAWRGALSVDKGDGNFRNAYFPDQTYFNKDRVSGRIKLLLTPTSDFKALATVEVQPNGAEFYNSGTVNTPTPAAYTNKPNVSTADGTYDYGGKWGRSWFLNQNYGQNFYNSGYLNNTSPDVNSQAPLYTSTSNESLKLVKNFDGFDLTSISAFRQYHFEARNDDGSPFNISVNGGGKVGLYNQASQELRLSGNPNSLVDLQSGLIFFRNEVDYGFSNGANTSYGNDAGAYYAKNAQYAILDADATGQRLMEDSLDGLTKSSTQKILNKSIAWYGQADWHITEDAGVTTGLRLSHEDRTNDTTQLIINPGVGAILNPVSQNGIALGGFATDSSGTLTSTSTAAKQAADLVAERYFGAPTNLPLGGAYGTLNAAQKLEVATAKAIRSTQIGTLWGPLSGPAFRKSLPGFLVSPTYKLNPNQTAYFTFQYGEKGGVSQVINGEPKLAPAERAASFELGLKNNLLDKTLLLNADIFRSVIHNYQQTVATTDPLNASAIVTYIGSAPQVNISGLEVDGSYSGIKFTTLHASASYTRAVYKVFDDSPLPIDDTCSGGACYQNVSGQLLPGASLVNFAIGGEFRYPIVDSHVFHTSFNTSYSSKYNSDTNLSTYAWIPAHSTTDLALGIGRRDEKFDVSVIVKNAFNDTTPQSRTWTNYIPAIPRWFGVQFAGKF